MRHCFPSRESTWKFERKDAGIKNKNQKVAREKFEEEVNKEKKKVKKTIVDMQE